ncbi:helix-turn-helix domain-containing protein [Sphingopyxis sp.]|uniref:helix-turn-helix domain-containing protein n=1 Tax=Sphingopyxis sp. TaxID=1908224 RepID=UPI0025D05FD5|nr:helix-turn-helix domain-containing protein [Sphingopyxis sp.]
MERIVRPTAETSGGDFEPGYFEETYVGCDIEVRPAEVGRRRSSAGTRPTATRAARHQNMIGSAQSQQLCFNGPTTEPGTPASQAEVKNKLADWFAGRDEQPSESLLKNAPAGFRSFGGAATRPITSPPRVSGQFSTLLADGRDCPPLFFPYRPQPLPCGDERKGNGAMEPVLCSIADAARMLGIGRTKAYELIDDGSLATITIGTRRLVKLDSIKRLAEGPATRDAA